MSLVLGTNCGFVTVAPTANPFGSASIRDGYAGALKDVAPVGAGKITRIGWWSDNISAETNFEVGLYTHNAGGNKPGTQLYVSATNAKGTAAGWKTVTVDWAIEAGTTYWIAYQIDNTSDATRIDLASSGGTRDSFVAAATLPATWATGSTENPIYLDAVYAVWEAGATYVDVAGIIAGTSDLSGTLSISTIVDIAGVIAGTSDLSGTVSLYTIIDIAGIIAGTSNLSGAIILSSNWQISQFRTIKRLIAAGNDTVYYEDI